MNGFFEFASNLADGLFWAMLPLTAAATLIGILSWSKRDFGYDRLAPHSSDYINATWRMHTAAQGIVLMWLIWGIINAVPEPDYIYRDRIVEKKVNAASTYFDVFERCKKDMGNDFTLEERKFCDDRALVLSKPGAVLVRHPKAKTITKTVVKYRPDPYQQLFDNCIRKYPTVYADHESLEENISDRIRLCHSQAKDVRESIPGQ